MRYLTLFAAIFFINVITLVSAFGQASDSLPRWVDYFSVYRKDLNIAMLRTHASTNRIFVFEQKLRSMLLLNPQTEKVESQISLGDPAEDVAFSKDPNQSYLAVASTGGTINLFDTTKPAGAWFVRTLKLPSALAQYRPVSLDFLGDNSIVFSITARPKQTNTEMHHPIYRIDSNTGALLGSIAGTSGRYRQGSLIRTDSSGQIIYIGERYVSPASLEKIVLSAEMKVVSSVRSLHGELGSNLRTIALAPSKIFLVSGAPYGVQELDERTLRLRRLIPTTAYPNAVTVSTDSRNIYSTSYDTFAQLLYRFGANDQSAGTYKLGKVPGQNYYFQNYSSALNDGIAISPDGSKAFVVTGVESQPQLGHRIQVVDTRIPPASCEDRSALLARNLNSICSILMGLPNVSTDIKNHIQPFCRASQI